MKSTIHQFKKLLVGITFFFSGQLFAAAPNAKPVATPPPVNSGSVEDGPCNIAVAMYTFISGNPVCDQFYPYFPKAPILAYSKPSAMDTCTGTSGRVGQCISSVPNNIGGYYGQQNCFSITNPQTINGTCYTKTPDTKPVKK